LAQSDRTLVQRVLHSGRPRDALHAGTVSSAGGFVLVTGPFAKRSAVVAIVAAKP
jgi:hypothetical protein